MKKIGVITFHNSYNCGSMLETFAMQNIMKKYGNTEIIDYASDGQKELYALYRKKKTFRNVIVNCLFFMIKSRILRNNRKYENFKEKYFNLSRRVDEESVKDLKYDVLVAGSDQIWNTTIADFTETYFLNWSTDAEKIAYAPSFGAKNPEKFYHNLNELRKYLSDFSALSIRENNGQKWLSELGFKDVPVLLDPTLLVDRAKYEAIEDKTFLPKEKYIFFYSPTFDRETCRFVKSVAKKYGLKVITWSAKSYYVKFVKQFGFELPPYEDPAVYLHLIHNADLVFTTSYHGTIFSTIYQKKFYCLKNGGMYGDDDRVITLLHQLNMMDRLIEYKFDEKYDYFTEVDYKKYAKSLKELQKKSIDYLDKALK